MADNNKEMSLDEVLSSIKKMVIDEEPPVFELTDMIAENGQVVKVKKEDAFEQKSSSEMGSFLKLIQDNDVSTPETSLKNQQVPQPAKTDTASNSARTDAVSYNKDTLHQFLSELMEPMLQKWIDDHMPEIAGKIVERELQKAFGKTNK